MPDIHYPGFSISINEKSETVNVTVQRYQGTCDTCKKPIPIGRFVQGSVQRNLMWHLAGDPDCQVSESEKE
jgi:hypothetical protein